MAGQNQEQEKTEEPTARRLEKAREEGNVNKSTELSSVLLMIVSTGIIYTSGPMMYHDIRMLFQEFLTQPATPSGRIGHMTELLEQATWAGLKIMMPLLTGLVFTALIVNLAQTKGVFATKALKPKASRISPAKGLKRMFSMRGAVELIKGLLKITIVAAIVILTLDSQIDHFLSYMLQPLGDILPNAGSWLARVLIRIFTALLFLSIADALYQYYQHNKDLRMSKQEVKDEQKQTEGDPQVKSRRREAAMKQRENKRLDHAVLQSDVVVTNPTHYAVALSYDAGEDQAPIVQARGIRKRALRIRELACEFDVPIVENPPVARAIYAAAREDEPVPPTLYQAVAEILAYVYRLRNDKQSPLNT